MGFGVDPGSWTSRSRAAWPSSSWCRIGGEPCAVQPDAFVIRPVTPRGFWLVNWFRRTPEHQPRALVDEPAGFITSEVPHAPIHATNDSARSKKQSRAP